MIKMVETHHIYDENCTKPAQYKEIVQSHPKYDKKNENSSQI